MMLRGHILTGRGRAAHNVGEWQRCTLVSFGLNACPNLPSLNPGMRLNGIGTLGTVKSAEQIFSDYRHSRH